MKIALIAVATLSLFARPASAADKPVIGPVPAWVKPVSPAAVPAKPDEAPVHILLSDQQVSLEPGRETIYSEGVFLVQTPQGLGAGNISLPWRPETDTLTVHKLIIRRGGQVIDVLASGQTFTVLRRETNLETATLDGVLTANIQPEGLQVGDIIDLAFSVTSSDPVMKGHVEQALAAWNGNFGHAHLRIQWPSTMAIQTRLFGTLPPLKITKAGGITSAELSADNLEPMLATKGAPARYQLGRLVETTDFTSWADLGALLTPLYQKSAILPASGPLRTELDHIRDMSPDPKVRAEAALALVQNRVRYVALLMGAGGQVPADAETTWARRYGDCKAKTALLLALLHALDIEAVPVAVNAIIGDGTDAHLPMIGMFNHVLVRATIGGKAYWLDGTRTGDTSLDRLAVPDFGWGLPLVPTGAALVKMEPAPLDRPNEEVAIRIDASGGLAAPAPIRIETILRGDEAVGTNLTLANLGSDGRERAMRKYWKDQYDFVTVKTANTSFDAQTGELRMTMDGDARLSALDDIETDGTGVGYKADFGREPGQNATAPFAVAYPYYNQTRETIILPEDSGAFRPGPGIELDQTVAGIHYRRHARLVGNVFTIEKTEQSLVPEFPAKDAPAAQKILTDLYDKVAKLQLPPAYKATQKDLSSARSDAPTTFRDFLNRGVLFNDQGQYAEALADFDKAIAMDPNSGIAWVNRANTKVNMGDLKGCKEDLVKAEMLDPDQTTIFSIRGTIARIEGRYPDAVQAFTTSLTREPDPWAFQQRAKVYFVMGNDAKALDDAAAALKLDPSLTDLRVLRTQLYLKLKQPEQAITEINSAVAYAPDDVWPLANRAVVYAKTGNVASAERDFAAARAKAKDADGLNSLCWAKATGGVELESALADCNAALSLKPNDIGTLDSRGLTLLRLGRLDLALIDYNQVLAKDADSATSLYGRAVIWAKKGDKRRSDADIAAALLSDGNVKANFESYGVTP